MLGPRRIVALTGRKGSGKDTLCQGLMRYCRENQIHYHTLSYGIPIRQIAAHISNLDIYRSSAAIREERDTIMTDWRWDELNPSIANSFPNHGEIVTASELLDIVAEELFRNTFSPMTWIKAMNRELAATSADVCFITDLRKLAEVEQLRRWPLTIIKVINPAQLHDNQAYITEAEIGQIPADYVYHSDRSRSEEQVWLEVETLCCAIFESKPPSVTPS